MSSFQTCNLTGKEKLEEKKISPEVPREDRIQEKMIIYQKGNPCGNKCYWFLSSYIYWSINNRTFMMLIHLV